MTRLFRGIRKFGPINIMLLVIVVSCLATILDSWLYLSFATRGGGGILATLNPLRLVRYMLSPLGMLMRVLLFLPLIYVVLFPNALPHLFWKYGRAN